MPYPYPGRSKVEAAVSPAATVVARKIVAGRVIDALGWWHLRQHYSRAELVAGGIVARSGSYRQDSHFEELVGKPVHEVTRSELDTWVKSLAHQEPSDH